MITAKDVSKIIGFDEPKLKHVKDKILRDAFHTKGNNKLNPYKNRSKRWTNPIIVLKDEKPPTSWKEAKINESVLPWVVEPVNAGWGYYILHDTWKTALDKFRKKVSYIKKDVGRFKVGLPFDEAASEKDCVGVGLTLAYQAHKILGKTDSQINKDHPDLTKAVEPFSALKQSTCIFCLNEISPKGFILATEDTEDVFYKRKEAEDSAIQMFHIKCLRPGEFLHRPGNVAWGHRRCNVALGKHDIQEGVDWFVEVLKNRGVEVKK